MMSRFLLHGDSFRNPNVFLMTGFLAPDPVIYLESGDSKVLAVPTMEQPRAARESRVDDIRGFDDLGYQAAADRTGNRTEATCETVANLVAAFPDGALQVEANFPVLIADRLRQLGITLQPSTDLLVQERRHKSAGTVEALSRAQARAEKAVADVFDMLSESEIVGDRVVFRGVPLTSERIRSAIEVGFAKHDFASQSMIVATGPRSSDPHWDGSGPVRPHQPLILDLFPQDRKSRYHGDVTRTYVKGQPADCVLRMYESVKKAHALALELIKPGVNGRDVHKAVQHSFEQDGFGDDGQHNARFTHGTGHGLGLEVHEQPSIGKVDMELLEGDVVTVEPGLYDPEVGGVRLEDVVVLTAEGNRNLNRLPKDLVIP
jgi:Xaa-Pro aminopeptidase